MDASHDHRDYPNTDVRVFWLAQVSEAATAFAGTRVPDQFKKSTATSKVSFEPVSDAKYRRQQQHSRVRECRISLKKALLPQRFRSNPFLTRKLSQYSFVPTTRSIQMFFWCHLTSKAI
jgi:hypothetical protein